MFIYYIKHTLIAAICTIKHLTLSVENKFLEIKRNCLGNAEIFSVLRHIHFHFLTNPEKMVNGIAAGENYRRVILNIDLLLAEFLCRDGLKLYKWMKIKINIVFSAQLEVRRFIALRLWLSNKNPFFVLVGRLTNLILYHIQAQVGGKVNKFLKKT